MASGKLFVRQTAWISCIPQFLFMASLCVVYIISIESKFLAIDLAMITYLCISITLKVSISYHHRKGIALSKANKFDKAIEEFEKSYSFFSKHPWIDKFRFITLLSSGGVSYREMALLNIAFCYSQSGDGKKSKEYYLKAVKEFPNSELANTSLKMIESIENQNA